MFYNLSITTDDLIVFYSNIINNLDSNYNKDKIIAYFRILSDATFTELKLFEDIYLKKYTVDENTPYQELIAIQFLINHNLIERDGIRYTDLNGTLKGIYKVSKVGLDFFNTCCKN